MRKTIESLLRDAERRAELADKAAVRAADATARERTRQRRDDRISTAILGGAMIASIRHGRFSADYIWRVVESALTTDRERQLVRSRLVRLGLNEETK